MSQDQGALNTIRANVFRVNQRYHDTMIRQALWAVDLWSKHSDPYAIMAADYWRNIAIGWASR